MSKRILSAFLTFALILSCSVASAISVRAADDTKIYVDGVAMTDGDYLSVGAAGVIRNKPSGGYAHYSNNVLTLHNFENKSGKYTIDEFDNECAIYRPTGDLNIVLSGNNTINTGNVQWRTAIELSGGKSMMTISQAASGGTLNIFGGELSYGISAPHVTIESGTFNINTDFCIEAFGDLCVDSIGVITIWGGKFDLTGLRGCIESDTIIIHNGEFDLIVNDNRSYADSGDENYFAIGYWGTFEYNQNMTIKAAGNPGDPLVTYNPNRHDTYDVIKITHAHE